MKGMLVFRCLACCVFMASALSENHDQNAAQSPSVLVIGLGPAGLSFLHAVATTRKQLKAAGDVAGLRALPRVTAVERASGPGGIWREHTNKGDNEYRNMYGDLWTNHPKETFEYPDYTFADHFGDKEFPTFLRREHVRDYILTRVTSVENVFETNEVYFRTEANNVRYSKRKGQFVATLNQWKEDESTENTVSKTWTTSSTLYFDKVIWSGGWNGVPSYPAEVAAILDQGRYKGMRLHSLAVDSIPNDSIANKTIVLIGDNDSANDIAYQMLKRGANKVMIASRSDKGSASLLPSWPENKVEILRHYQLAGVAEDGTGLLFGTDDAKRGMLITDVSVVILCTGYDPNVNSLSPELSFALQHLWSLPGTLAIPSSYKKHGLENDSWDVPNDWEMPRNVLTDELANLNGGNEHIEPDLGKAMGSYISNKYVYRNVFIYNTNLFFNHETTYQQLFDIDVSAWLILGYITGEVSIPDVKTMEQRNLDDVVLQMENPNNRYHVDREYASKLDLLRKDKEHWYSHGRDSRKRELYKAEFEVQVKLLARDMEDAKYPASYGNVSHLNQNGIDLVEMSVDFYHNKYWIGYKDDRNLHNPARGWTYRDMDCSTYKSLWSGFVSTPFAGHWLDVDDHGCLGNDASDCGIPRVLKSMDSAFLGRPLPPGADVVDDTDVDGIQSLFEDGEVFDVAIIVLAALLFISATTRIAFAKESDSKRSSNGVNKSARTTRSRRFHSIDVLRGLCVVNMISIHFGEYLSAQWFRNCSLFGTPAFLLVAGLSFQVLSASAKRKGEGVMGRVLKRAIFLYLLQAAQSMVLNGNIGDIYACETLMIAGHAQLLLGMVHNVRAPFLTLSGTIIIFTTGAVRVAFMDIDEYWRINNIGDSVSFDPVTDDLLLEDVFHFHVVDGLFPLFPYAAYPILGLAIGKVIYGPSNEGERRSRHLKLLAMAGGMILASGVALWTVGKLAPSLIDKSRLYGVYIGSWRSWPYESLEHVLVSVGRSLLWVVVASKLFDGAVAERETSLRGSIRDFFSVYGRFSLTLFSLHHVVIYGILGIGGYMSGESYLAMFENMFELKMSLVLGSAFLLWTRRFCLWLERESIPTLEHLQRLFCRIRFTSTSIASAMESQGDQLMKRPKSTRSRRFRSIDVLRGLCVFNMIFVHFGEYLSAQWFRNCSLCGTPTFLLVAGLSFHVLSESAKLKGQGVIWQTCKRAMFLYLLQAAQSMLLNQNVDDIYVCETLMIAGHAQLLLGMVHKLPASILTLFGVIIIGVTGFVRVEYMEIDEYWRINNVGGGVSFEPLTEDSDLEDIFQFHVVDGVFPLFPYAAYPILGLAIGKTVYEASNQPKSRSRYLKMLTIAGGILLASGAGLLTVGKLRPYLIDESSLYGVYIGSWRSWPYESLEHALVSLGRSLLYVVVATKLFDGGVPGSIPPSLRASIRDFFCVYGRFSLTLFSLHHVVIYGILGIGGYRSGESYQAMFENMFELKTSLVLALIFLLLTHRLCLWLERKSIPALEDLQRLLCTSRLTITPVAGPSKKYD